ncbi:MFS transporter [Haloferax mediterranei ATCC 33500]|uniref:MFS transporter n=1 Tax=Haloferax mediterranei (strain ATCC 33500 / DSM 1411 / JCM 8866 / NBRC 14739 / NCIMB 2177 / R-4) TaxID=523841 RepID=I3R416_HALMT|nr:MFS transporter [Haloferax mediterranei]AFK18976.1 major facilitator superfamily transporter [Haloferax mediterranei ATCC 33500]AHZ21664.1 MFS transporter [Haloferax mediterranei ATCC 33500]MDX5989067.1 MFS transporter [Haloferax mediterranei ATCC 33500]QCQ76630.1 MFS transporter [Haloferax mediterranei ATCC 33500]
MTETQEYRVVGLVSGSHVVNHAYLVALAPVIGTVASEFGVSIAAVGLAIGVQGAVVTLLQLPFGYLSDSRSRTLVLALSLVVGTVGIVATAVAPTYQWLLVSQALLGVGIAGHHPAQYPLLATATSEASRGRAYSLHALGGSLGFAVPYAIAAGVDALGFGWRWSIVVLAVLGAGFSLVALPLARGFPESIRKPAAEDRPDSRPSISAVRQGATDLLASSGLMGLALLSFLTSAAAWCIRTYSPQLLADGYGLLPSTANLLVSGMLVTGAGMILLGGTLTDRIGPGNVALGGYAALVGLAALLASGSLPLALLVLVLPFSGTISVSRPARSTLADRLSARSDLGKSFAVVTVGISLGGAVAPPAFGALIDVSGVRVAFGVVAVLGVLSLGMTQWLLGRVDGSARDPKAAASD